MHEPPFLQGSRSSKHSLTSSRHCGGLVEPAGQRTLVLSEQVNGFEHELIRVEHVSPVNSGKHVQIKPVAILAQIPPFSQGCDRQ